MKISVEVNENGSTLLFAITLSPGGAKKPVMEEFQVVGADTSKIEEWLHCVAAAEQPEGDTPKTNPKELVAAFDRIVGDLSHKLVAIEEKRNRPDLGYGTFTS